MPAHASLDDHVQMYKYKKYTSLAQAYPDSHKGGAVYRKKQRKYQKKIQHFGGSRTPPEQVPIFKELQGNPDSTWYKSLVKMRELMPGIMNTYNNEMSWSSGCSKLRQMASKFGQIKSGQGALKNIFEKVEARMTRSSNSYHRCSGDRENAIHTSIVALFLGCIKLILTMVSVQIENKRYNEIADLTQNLAEAGMKSKFEGFIFNAFMLSCKQASVQAQAQPAHAQLGMLQVPRQLHQFYNIGTHEGTHQAVTSPMHVEYQQQPHMAHAHVQTMTQNPPSMIPNHRLVHMDQLLNMHDQHQQQMMEALYREGSPQQKVDELRRLITNHSEAIGNYQDHHLPPGRELTRSRSDPNL